MGLEIKEGNYLALGTMVTKNQVTFTFECEKEDLRAAAMVAKAVLVEDFNVLKQIPVPSKNRWMGQFREHIPSSWIKNQRVKCGEICTEQYLPKSSSVAAISAENYTKEIPCIVKKRLYAGTVVKKGEELISYEESVKKKKPYSYLYGVDFYDTVIEKKVLTAPCDGVVFFIESNKKGKVSDHMDKFFEVYVVSYFDDYAEFRGWHKKK